jgi:hypothetical protein
MKSGQPLQNAAVLVTRLGEKINAYTILVGKRKGKIPLGIRKRRWEDHIKIEVKEIGWECMD